MKENGPRMLLCRFDLFQGLISRSVLFVKKAHTAEVSPLLLVAVVSHICFLVVGHVGLIAVEFR